MSLDNNLSARREAALTAQQAIQYLAGIGIIAQDRISIILSRVVVQA